MSLGNCEEENARVNETGHVGDVERMLRENEC